MQLYSEHGFLRGGWIIRKPRPRRNPCSEYSCISRLTYYHFYLYKRFTQQLAAPIVLVGPVVLLHQTIPIEKYLPNFQASQLKLLVPGTLNTMIGISASAGKDVVL